MEVLHFDARQRARTARMVGQVRGMSFQPMRGAKPRAALGLSMDPRGSARPRVRAVGSVLFVAQDGPHLAIQDAPERQDDRHQG